jgi:hypothetical protein
VEAKPNFMTHPATTSQILFQRQRLPAMSIPVICPGCQKRLWVAEKFADRPINCPACGTPVRFGESPSEVDTSPSRDSLSVVRTAVIVVHSLSGLLLAILVSRYS